jgi:hypothetical protein
VCPPFESKSSGDLADDPDLPNIIVSLLQDVNAIVKNSGKESPFKRLTGITSTLLPLARPLKPSLHVD